MVRRDDGARRPRQRRLSRFSSRSPLRDRGPPRRPAETVDPARHDRLRGLHAARAQRPDRAHRRRLHRQPRRSVPDAAAFRRRDPGSGAFQHHHRAARCQRGVARAGGRPARADRLRLDDEQGLAAGRRPRPAGVDVAASAGAEDRAGRPARGVAAGRRGGCLPHPPTGRPARGRRPQPRGHRSPARALRSIGVVGPNGGRGRARDQQPSGGHRRARRSHGGPHRRAISDQLAARRIVPGECPQDPAPCGSHPRRHPPDAGLRPPHGTAPGHLQRQRRRHRGVVLHRARGVLPRGRARPPASTRTCR